MKISNETVADKIDAALRLRVGHGKTYSFEALEEVTGIKARTLRSYEEGAVPTVAGLLSICAALGPGFTSDIIGMAGQSAPSSAADEPDHFRAVGSMGAMIHSLYEALADGRIDHRETALLRPMAAELMEMLAPIAEASKPTVVRKGGAG